MTFNRCVVSFDVVRSLEKNEHAGRVSTSITHLKNICDLVFQDRVTIRQIVEQFSIISCG